MSSVPDELGDGKRNDPLFLLLVLWGLHARTRLRNYRKSLTLIRVSSLFSYDNSRSQWSSDLSSYCFGCRSGTWLDIVNAMTIWYSMVNMTYRLFSYCVNNHLSHATVARSTTVHNNYMWPTMLTTTTYPEPACKNKNHTLRLFLRRSPSWQTTAPDSTRASPLETNDVSRLKQSSSNAGGDANDAVVDGNTSSVNKLYRRADQVYPAAIRQLATATTSISHRPSSTK